MMDYKHLLSMVYMDVSRIAHPRIGEGKCSSVREECRAHEIYIIYCHSVHKIIIVVKSSTRRSTRGDEV